MMTVEQNQRLTEVEGDAMMGKMMREHFWIPCALSEKLVADGDPQLIRLLGENYVAFRATDGRLGFLDEACPHRRASLLLARNENCGLRCIFHAWKIDVSGRVVDVPSEGARSEMFGTQVRVNHYPTFEGGGLVWVYLGKGDPPPRPPVPFLELPKERVFASRSTSPCNWFQGIEGALDSVHIGTLHQSWVPKINLDFVLDSHPRYEVEDTAYGMRAAAIRPLAGGQRNIRVSEWVMPFCALHPASSDGLRGSAGIAVPMDNHSHMFFMLLWNENGPYDHVIEQYLRSEERPIDDYALVKGNREQAWHQDRQAMANGHFSGFCGNILDEDLVMQVSMGAITDRTREQLCASDVGVARGRRRILRALTDFERGNLPPLAVQEVARPIDMFVGSDYSWRENGGCAEVEAVAFGQYA